METIQPEVKFYVKIAKTIAGAMVYSYRYPHKKSVRVYPDWESWVNCPLPNYNRIVNIANEAKTIKIYDVFEHEEDVEFLFENIDRDDEIKFFAVQYGDGTIERDSKKIHPDLLAYCEFGEILSLKEVDKKNENMRNGNHVKAKVKVRNFIYE